VLRRRPEDSRLSLLLLHTKLPQPRRVLESSAVWAPTAGTGSAAVCLGRDRAPGRGTAEATAQALCSLLGPSPGDIEGLEKGSRAGEGSGEQVW